MAHDDQWGVSVVGLIRQRAGPAFAQFAQGNVEEAIRETSEPKFGGFANIKENEGIPSAARFVQFLDGCFGGAKWIGHLILFPPLWHGHYGRMTLAWRLQPKKGAAMHDLAVLLFVSLTSGDATMVNTFSLCAVDPVAKEVGVAVTTRVPRVGRLVPFVKAGVGAVATQALVEVRYGPEGLALLEQGVAPAEALRRMLEPDSGRAHRQIGLLPLNGKGAVHTGSDCMAYAGHRVGRNYVAQGNLLASRSVIDKTADAFEATEGSGLPLADRLIRALEAGQAAGGDARTGRLQSAALVIAREGDPNADRANPASDGTSLRLDVAEHPEPVAELRRQYDTIFRRLGYRSFSLVQGPDVAQLKVMLHRLGHFRPMSPALPSPVDEPGILVFDVETAEAVDRFRRAAGLSVPADGKGHEAGIVDPPFVRALTETYARSRRQASAPSKPSEKK